LFCCFTNMRIHVTKIFSVCWFKILAE
jgi:hypothetical protein